MTDETTPSPDRPDDPEKGMTRHEQRVEAAFTEANWAITREAMTRVNQHDLNNIRTSLSAIKPTILDRGEDGFHRYLKRLQKQETSKAFDKLPDPLVYRGMGIVAERLGYSLTKKEWEMLELADLRLIFQRESVQQRPEDVHINMRDLKEQITPDGRFDKGFVYPTHFNPDDYMARQIGWGIPLQTAAKNAATLAITINRIGLSLKRFKPSHNNPVQFLDLVVENVLQYNNRIYKEAPPPLMKEYLDGWRMEVKRDFMGVRDPEEVRNTISQVALDILRPAQRTLPSSRYSDSLADEPRTFMPRKLATELRQFRSRPDTAELPRKLSAKTVSDSAAIFAFLLDNYEERHDVQRYFDVFLESPAYARMNPEVRRTISLVMEETCNRLQAPKPTLLNAKFDIPAKPDVDAVPAPRKTRGHNKQTTSWRDFVEIQTQELRDARRLR